MRHYKFRTFLILTLLWLAIVLLQAFLPGDASYAESNGVLALAQVVFPWLTHSALRHAAHVIEYFLLGFLLAAYLNVPVLGIALLGVIIVALMLVNDQNKPNNTAVVDGGADDDF